MDQINLTRWEISHYHLSIISLNVTVPVEAPHSSVASSRKDDYSLLCEWVWAGLNSSLFLFVCAGHLISLITDGFGSFHKRYIFRAFLQFAFCSARAECRVPYNSSARRQAQGVFRSTGCLLPSFSQPPHTWVTLTLFAPLANRSVSFGLAAKVQSIISPPVPPRESTTPAKKNYVFFLVSRRRPTSFQLYSPATFCNT